MVFLSHSVGESFEVQSKFQLRDGKIFSMKVKTIKLYRDSIFPSRTIKQKQNEREDFCAE